MRAYEAAVTQNRKWRYRSLGISFFVGLTWEVSRRHAITFDKTTSLMYNKVNEVIIC